MRLERARDGGLSWGRLPFFGGESARLRFGTPQEAALGERYTVQVLGSARVTTFVAEVTGQEAGEVTLRVLGEVRCMPPSLPPRTSIARLVGRVTVEGAEADGEVVDASERGMGLLLPISVEPGMRVVIEVASENGPVEVSGEARYCRALDAPAGRFRVGILIEPPSPWIATQWARLIEVDPSVDHRAA